MTRAVVAAVPALAALAAAPNVDGPPPAHTGGFGEPTCAECHHEFPPNAPGGALRLEGLPAAFEPGRTYDITVVLGHPELRSAGFELSVRYSDGAAAGRQAGELSASGTRVAITASGGVSYAHHQREGSPVSGSETRWSLRWRTPERPAGDIVLHAAANAANDDASPLGDRIYVVQGRSAARAGPR